MVSPIEMKQKQVRSNPEGGGDLRRWDEGRLIDPTRQTGELDALLDPTRPFGELDWSNSPNGRVGRCILFNAPVASSVSWTMGVSLYGIRCLRP
ncbi:hypothetical protein F2Q70_00011834 [Brassica cretica]|uniref:Uncharacterized protein n=1 Tax=Brassica cretica TaxID=69181 RepID=A0A8S9M5R6_BRACR|nr:hypothetical protein F2Q70_00011834 [Brassica cretica]